MQKGSEVCKHHKGFCHFIPDMYFVTLTLQKSRALERFHEITEFRLKKPQPKAMLEAALAPKSDQVAQGIIQWGFQKDGEQSLPGQSVQLLDCPHGRRAFPYIHFELFNYCFN